MLLTPLLPRHHQALLAFEQDWVKSGEARIHGYFADPEWPHERKVDELGAWAESRLLKPGWVACTTRFLEVEGSLVGVVNIRHELTPELREVGGHIGYSVRPSARRRGYGTRLLAGGLQVCRSLGIERALVTCDADNLGSVGVIRNQGGVLFESDAGPGQPTIYRYWVPIPPLRSDPGGH